MFFKNQIDAIFPYLKNIALFTQVTAIALIGSFGCGIEVGRYCFPQDPDVIHHVYIEPQLFESNQITVEVVRVCDGDTFVANISGWPDIIGKNIEIRINGIDAPEIHDRRPRIKKMAQKSKQFVCDKIKNCQKIELQNLHRDKYFRIDAEVIVDGKNLGEELISNGLAKKYNGKTKVDWE